MKQKLVGRLFGYQETVFSQTKQNLFYFDTRYMATMIILNAQFKIMVQKFIINVEVNINKAN